MKATKSNKKEVLQIWSLDYMQVTTGTQVVPTATIRLKRSGIGELPQDASTGKTAVDAVIQTINRIALVNATIISHTLQSSGTGDSLLPHVCIYVCFNNRYKSIVVGKATNKDFIEAYAHAYIDALNQFIAKGVPTAKAA